VLFPGLRAGPPPGWEVLGCGEGVQLVADTLDPEPDPEVEPLGTADVPAMLRLATLAKPGPFLPRTVEFGGYLGIRRDGELVATATRPRRWWIVRRAGDLLTIHHASIPAAPTR